MAQPDNNNTLSSAFKTFFEREKLTGHNFNDWYRSLRIVMRVAGTYDYLFKPCPDEPPENAAENVKAAWKAEYKIHSDVACLMLGMHAMDYGVLGIFLEYGSRVTTLIAKFLILDIPIDHDSPIVVGRGFLCTIGGIINTLERLFSTFDGICHQTFRAARSDVMRNTESDSDDEEEYEIKRNNYTDVMRNTESDSDDEEEYKIKRNKFGAPIYGLKPAPYLSCNDPDERSLAIQTVTNPFQKISVWKKAVSFLGSLLVPLKQVNWKPDYKGSLQEHMIMRLDHQDPNAQDNMKPWKRMGYDGEIDDILRIRLREAGSDEEIFTSVAWIRDFNINEIIYAELCRDLGGRARSLTLLNFARRLGLYQVVELDEEVFNVYFEGAWVIARWMKRKGARTKKESQICCGQFILKIARKFKVLTEDVVRSLSALIYCRDLDMIRLRDLINSKGKLIPEDPQLGVPRVGIPRPPRASMQDLHDRMGGMEIRQDAIERMEYRQSYH
ncbi:hypothetical protein Tco_1078474 [Tanacetum coccineum]|uniref:Zinc finger, CCHC-type n=1 Tax=Tanacetum coccineum TaxID=301880 RepID=A0ABQ5HPZ8_9ASTR